MPGSTSADVRLKIVAVALAALSAAAHAGSLEFAAVTIDFPNPDALVRFDLNAPGPVTHVAALAGGFVRGFDMDSPSTGWYVSTSGSAPGFYRYVDGVSLLVSQLPDTSIQIGGLTLNEDQTFLYYAISGPPVLLYRIDFNGNFTLLGPVSGIPNPRIGGLAVHPHTGTLYALNMPDGRLYTIEGVIASPVGTGLGFSVANLVGGLTFTPAGRLFMASNQGEIREIDPSTGVAGPVLAHLGTSTSSIAWLPAEPQPCYPNCDGSTTQPILTVDDFTCFINEFAHAQTLPPQQQIEHYANCDGSTTEPILTVDDFTCFINAFAQGCP